MRLVVWDEAALDQLADIWVQVAGSPGDKVAVENAVNRINRLLKDDPTSQGEARSGNWRVACEPPLAVTFHVDPGSGDVTVGRVRLLRFRD